VSNYQMSQLGSLRSSAYRPSPGRPAILAARLGGLFVQLVFVASLLFALPLSAQVQGVPAMEFHGVPTSGIGGASTAFSSGRSNTGMPGPGAAFGCCASFFFPSSFSPIVPYPYPSVATGHREHRGHHHRRDEVVGVADSVYIPYAVPYAVDSDGYAEDQDDAGAAVSPASEGEDGGLLTSRVGIAGRRQLGANGAVGEREQKSDDDSGYNASGDSDIGSAPEAPPDPPEPVVAQPTTVLVFKDGHRSEVVNYAIVGDSLFDFSGDRTHKILIADLDIPATKKANDASGVEFKLPLAAEAAGSVKNGTN
jgi:hypothetical protein